MTLSAGRAVARVLIPLAVALALAAAGCQPPSGSTAPGPVRSSEAAVSPLPTPEDDEVGEGVVGGDQRLAGGSVVFHRREKTGWFHVYVLDLQTNGLTALTTGQHNNFDPALSPDGTQIAFISDRDHGSEYGTLWIMGSDGSNQRALLPPGGFFELGPTWSPDGSALAFQSNREGNPEIQILELATNSLRNLTQHPNTDATPAWSPNGQEIAFTSDRAGSPDLWSIGVDGGGLTQITDTPIAAEWRPAWSPDGEQIACELSRVPYRRTLVVLDPDTGNMSEIETPHDLDYWPSWASGDVLLFAASETFDESRQKPSPSFISQIDLRSGSLSQLTSGPESDGRPSYWPGEAD